MKKYSESYQKKKKSYEKNREKTLPKMRAYGKIWRAKNKEKIREKRRKYYLENKESSLKKSYEYEKERKKVDEDYKLRKNRLRRMVRQAFHYYSKTGKILVSTKYGIDYEKIINHLKPFPKDLSKYHIDHIKPLCSFDLTDPDQIKKAFAPENHQWLLAEQNLVKGGRW